MTQASRRILRSTQNDVKCRRPNAGDATMNSKHDENCGCPGRLSGPMTRREMLKTATAGFGTLALSALMADEAYAGLRPVSAPHFRPRAKAVIFCFMDGGVSHVDS